MGTLIVPAACLQGIVWRTHISIGNNQELCATMLRVNLTTRYCFIGIETIPALYVTDVLQFIKALIQCNRNTWTNLADLKPQYADHILVSGDVMSSMAEQFDELQKYRDTSSKDIFQPDCVCLRGWSWPEPNHTFWIVSSIACCRPGL